ncbi:DUF2796 domain-containing protein [Verminephrobacter eiseniae]|uniref:ABC-type metal ion transport system, periplasmic component/surface adhesin n=1 Tax=Verminephrobacter eiseniae (strain EF01-2) TaxID=391735 RepID=A1WNB0_VEREI|nr:DUF2796 domain-containing protein [Verminephrobacter eiseniae]ABM59117.1 ABC-type metal ion transport system, periplasmic component/surface adhesin [Verminephrobacter eiseniae EF01-2]MCW5284665.1 DUF2796 domain-containing protein [Verminephrobacter eiseniae]MCW5302372.1 DUF2796 domain-containing protein [Verminephrobacter eiseniae]MCW8182189.1 DUF2796 domain-containing protein [Verminephrobacter eiseniae]MCW8190312.1 DUF2796 domain-containing protein [Verminephrobacter eiseniae]
MDRPPRHFRRAHCAALALSIWAAAASADEHAHTHGRLELDVAIDARSITLEIESPLDSFLGFEHAPRTDAQKKRVADMVARLNAADRLFRPDPAAECKLSRVALSSQALGLGDAEEESEHGPEPATRKKPAAGQQDEHADIDMTVVFSCAKASAARYIDIQLFNAFEGIRTIDAQVAAPQGQFKRRLSAPSPRLGWGR